MARTKLVSVKTIERLFKYVYIDHVEYVVDDFTNETYKVFYMTINNKSQAIYKLPAFAGLREENIERLYQVLNSKWERHKQ